MFEKTFPWSGSLLFLLIVLSMGCAGKSGTQQPVVPGYPTLEAGLDRLASRLSGEAGQGKELRLAVLTFWDLKQRQNDLGTLIAEGLITRLCNVDGFQVVERTRMDQVLGELQFNVQEVVDEASAQEAGRLLGVEVLLIGTAADLGNRVRINARMIETKTGRVLKAHSVEVEREEATVNLLASTHAKPSTAVEQAPTQQEEQVPTQPPAPVPSTPSVPSKPPPLEDAFVKKSPPVEYSPIPQRDRPVPSPRVLESRGRASLPIRPGLPLQVAKRQAYNRAAESAAVHFLRERIPGWQGLRPLRKKQLVNNLLRQSRVMVIRARKAGNQFHMEVRLVVPDSWSP